MVGYLTYLLIRTFHSSPRNGDNDHTVSSRVNCPKQKIHFSGEIFKNDFLNNPIFHNFLIDLRTANYDEESEGKIGNSVLCDPWL